MSTSIGELFLKLSVEGADRFKSVMSDSKGYVLAFGTAAGAASAAMVKLASDFNESSNVVQQAFGRGAASAEKWAETTGAAMGRSTQAMRESAAVMQAMLSPMVGNQDAAAGMSKAMAQLAVDMGSFWNVADPDAFNALRSAISGETEPMKRFGVVMTEAALNAHLLANGIDTTMQKLSEADKTQVRYNFLMTQTSMYQGDAVRTSDSLANQIKALEADFKNTGTAIGNELLPYTQNLVAAFREVFEFAGKGDGLKDLFVSLAELVKNVAVETMTWISRMIRAGAEVGAGLKKGVQATALPGAETAQAGLGAWASGSMDFATTAAKGFWDNLTPPPGHPLHGLLGGNDAAPKDVLEEQFGNNAERAADGLLRLADVLGEGADKQNRWTTKAGAPPLELGGGGGKQTQSEKDEAERQDFYRNNQDMLLGKSTMGGTAGGFGPGGAQFLEWVKPFMADGLIEMEKQLKAADKVAGAYFESERKAEEAKIAAADKAAADMVARQQKRDDEIDKALNAHMKKRLEAEQKQANTLASGALSAVSSLMRGDIGGAGASAGMSAFSAFGGDAAAKVAGPMGQLANMAAANVSSAITFIVDGIKKGFGMVFDTLATFGPRDGRIKGFMGTVGGAVAAGAPIHASPLGVISIPVSAALGLGAALLKLSQETESYGRFQKAMSTGTSEVVKALEPFWRNMMPVAGAFIMLSKSVGVLAGALMPGGSAVEWFATQALEAARGMSSIILGIFQVSLAFADARLSILQFAESVVPGSQFADSLQRAGESHKDAEEKVRQAAALREQLGKMTLSELGALAEASAGTAESMRSLSAAMTNIPSGFKGYAAAALAAMDPSGPGGGGGGGGDGMSATGRRQTDMEGRGREAGFGGERGVTVNGNVTIVANNVEEFQRAVSRKQFIQSGTPLLGIAAYATRS